MILFNYSWCCKVVSYILFSIIFHQTPVLSVDRVPIIFILLAPYLDRENTYLLRIFLLLTACALYLEKY